jgi:hypothetical protein
MAFEKLAAVRPSVELSTFARNFKLAGGARETWIQAYDDAPAAEMQSGGHFAGVRNDHAQSADALPPLPGNGQTTDVRNDPQDVADARSLVAGEEDHTGFILKDQLGNVPSAGAPIPGADQPTRADNGHSEAVGARNQLAGERAISPVPKRASIVLPPAREPSAGHLKAAADRRQRSAILVLDRYKVEDGRFWGDVRPDDVRSYMRRDYIRGTALMTACGALNPKQMRMTFRELLTPERALVAFQEAEAQLAQLTEYAHA